MPEIVTTIELTEGEIEKGQGFLDELLHNVYEAGKHDREMFELTEYPTFNASFEMFCKTLGLEV